MKPLTHIVHAANGKWHRSTRTNNPAREIAACKSLGFSTDQISVTPLKHTLRLDETRNERQAMRDAVGPGWFDRFGEAEPATVDEPITTPPEPEYVSPRCLVPAIVIIGCIVSFLIIVVIAIIQSH